MARTFGERRINYLDGIRGLAIGSVLIIHWVSPRALFGSGGYIGVDMFFVLSGYLITTLVWKNFKAEKSIWAQYTAFILRRLKRLYPALLAFVCLVSLLSLILFYPQRDANYVFLAGLGALTQGMSILAAQGHFLDMPVAITWSLSIEWIFYVFWPVVVLFFAKKEISAKFLVYFSFLLGTFFYIGSIFLDNKWFYFGPSARTGEILFGATIAFLFCNEQEKSSITMTLRLAKICAILLFPIFTLYVLFGPGPWAYSYRFSGYVLATAVTAVLIYVCVRDPSSRIAQLLSYKPLAQLGKVSYSLYLWHMLGLFVITKENSQFLPIPIVAIIGVLIGTVPAFGSYVFLEKPYLRRKMLG